MPTKLTAKAVRSAIGNDLLEAFVVPSRIYMATTT